MKLPTMADVAARAGVSKNAVSLALRNDAQIPERTRERIRRVAERMGYRKNATVAHLMAELRSRRGGRFQATLALVNANRDATAFRSHPTIPLYVEGARARAAQQGYALDEFWLHEPGWDAERLNRVLRSRGIRGVLLVGLMHDNHLPERFRGTWEQFPVVVTGVRTRDPALSHVCTDHHMLTYEAVDRVRRLGYRRPGLVLDPVIDRLVDGRFTSGFLTAQRDFADVERVRPFTGFTAEGNDGAAFHRWRARERPDVLLTLYNAVRRWVEDAGVRVPEELGLVQLEWRRSRPEWAGMDQHNDVTGAAAVDQLIAQVHNNEAGIPEFPRSTLIGSSWVDGRTVRAAAAAGRRQQKTRG
jgi:LacI family transcriptional regulator